MRHRSPTSLIPLLSALSAAALAACAPAAPESPTVGLTAPEAPRAQGANEAVHDDAASDLQTVDVSGRDPFRSRFLEPDDDRAEKPPLARVEIDQLRLVGTVTSVSTPMAMIEDRQGRGHRAKLGSEIGRQGGRVVEIDAGGVTVEERLVDGLGRIQRVRHRLQLPMAARAL